MGYTALLEGSSLQTVLSTGQPRIINNLPDYLAKKPSSLSTRLIVEEGMRSSLTCPLIANGKPIGFIFFSSKEPHIYDKTHASIFSMIASQLSMIIEKAVILNQNQNLQRLNERKTYYLDMAAHDIRSPVAQIQIAGQTAQEFFDVMSEEERGTFINTIIKQSNAVLGLLDNILDMGQIETGQIRLHLEPLSIKDFMEEIMRDQSKVAAAKDMHVLLSDVPHGEVVVDKLRLRQVMDNLISNAIKFSPRGSTIVTCVHRGDGLWRISIRDQGPGLSGKDRERAFQGYGRLSAKPTGGEKSTGLGLIIVRHLVEAHGGRVGVDSMLGHGATFWFTLPA
jgi:signal transduction histidine kinase